MKKLPLILIISALVFAGCSYSDREVSVKDVTKNETIILRKRPSQGWISSVSGIHVTGDGWIDGKAEVHLFMNGAVYKKEEISGKVSFEWDGDWYADQAEVRYVSDAAVGGTITLKYEFR
jgi:hypothetical protein